jgi:hypothetical protein
MSGEPSQDTPPEEPRGCYPYATRGPSEVLKNWSGWPDSNRRPPDPQSGALARLRYIPYRELYLRPATGARLLRRSLSR